MSIEGTTVNEGNGPGTAIVHLTLTKRSSVPVTASIQTLAGTGTQIASAAPQVVIPRGRLSVAVSVPVIGDTTTEATPDTVYKVFVLDPVNAVVGQDFAHITVHDDEAVPAERTVLVEHGVVKSLLMSRAPRKEIAKSNGHGRGFSGISAHAGNLFVSATNGAPGLSELPGVPSEPQFALRFGH